MNTQLTLPTTKTPEISPNDLVTKIRFDQSMYYQWHDKVWQDDLYITMGVATEDPEWLTNYSKFAVQTDRTAVLSQHGLNHSDKSIRIDSKASPQHQNGILIAPTLGNEVQLQEIVDTLTLAGGDRFVERTLVGEELLGRVSIELAKRSAADNRASRLVHCITYTLGALFEVENR